MSRASMAVVEGSRAVTGADRWFIFIMLRSLVFLFIGFVVPRNHLCFDSLCRHSGNGGILFHRSLKERIYLYSNRFPVALPQRLAIMPPLASKIWIVEL